MVDAGKSSPRFCEAVHKSENNWVSPCAENDGDLCGRPPRRYCAVFRICIDQVDSLLFKTFRCFLGCLCIALPISDTKSILFSLFKPQLAETKPKPVNDLVPRFARDKDTKTVDFRLLRLGGCAKSKEHNAQSKANDCLSHRILRVCCSLLFDHFIRSRQHIRRNRQADLLGSLQVNNKLKLHR